MSGSERVCSSVALVAPLAGSVDRNDTEMLKALYEKVAPLAGSVDRNNKDEGTITLLEVAPLAGSVDRNWKTVSGTAQANKSLPSRGAWIEIWGTCSRQQRQTGRSPRGERG